MQYISTNKKAEPVGFKQAIIRGLASDQGLFMPQNIPVSDLLRNDLQGADKVEIAFAMMRPFVQTIISDTALRNIVEETFCFELPLKQISPKMWSLELFHGPTLAFKDVGARFLARCLQHLLPKGERITILVATSGDTGSAVAQGFSGVEQVEVVLLYPSGKVSNIQEQQLTTAGNNVTALQVQGDFDDCQRLVKEAFKDDHLRNQFPITSANSINIARWLPQSVYYAVGVSQLPGSLADEKLKTACSVPSGNYGNLTAGILAAKMGAPIDHFIAASNINKTVPEFIKTGTYTPKASKETLSNAMDVGDPSNFARLCHLYNHNYEAIVREVSGYSYTDEQTLSAIKEGFNQFEYTFDPHAAIGYLGLKDFLADQTSTNWRGIILETAHPSKFHETVSLATGCELAMPERLRTCLDKESHSIALEPHYADFKEYLLSRV